MDVYTETIRDLSAADKLQLVERIWDDLAATGEPLPLPDWAKKEAARRRDEMLPDRSPLRTTKQQPISALGARF